MIDVHFTKSWAVTEIVYESFLNTFAAPSNSEDVTVMVTLAMAEGKKTGFKSGLDSVNLEGTMAITIKRIGSIIKIISMYHLRRSTVFARQRSV